jgi:hypothetical protein
MAGSAYANKLPGALTEQQADSEEIVFREPAGDAYWCCLVKVINSQCRRVITIFASFWCESKSAISGLGDGVFVKR